MRGKHSYYDADATRRGGLAGRLEAENAINAIQGGIASEGHTIRSLGLREHSTVSAFTKALAGLFGRRIDGEALGKRSGGGGSSSASYLNEVLGRTSDNVDERTTAQENIRQLFLKRQPDDESEPSGKVLPANPQEGGQSGPADGSRIKISKTHEEVKRP